MCGRTCLFDQSMIGESVMDVMNIIKAVVDLNTTICSGLLHRRPDMALINTLMANGILNRCTNRFLRLLWPNIAVRSLYEQKNISIMWMASLRMSGSNDFNIFKSIVSNTPSYYHGVPGSAARFLSHANGEDGSSVKF